DSFGTRAPSSGGSGVGSGTGAVDYTYSVGGLLPGTTYYYCAIASNAYGTSFGGVMFFTTKATAPATVTTSPMVTSGSAATLNGAANPTGDPTPGWFRYSASNPGSCNDTFGTRAPISGGSALGAGTSSVAFSQSISGLSPMTTYYVCAIAANSIGTTF